MQARRATTADLDVVVETLVASHVDYVWEVWALPGEDRAARLAELVRSFIDLVALRSRDVWMLDDGAGVAVWQSEPSGPLDPEIDRCMADVTREVYGERRSLIDAVDDVLHADRPTGPHWFLGTMGVRPDRQRQGLGGVLLRPVLDELDRTSMPACLETSARGNLVFYGALGFEVRAHLDDLPGGAPETWVMWRPPAGCR